MANKIQHNRKMDYSAKHPIHCIMQLLVKEYLESLDDETAAFARDILIDIIADDEQRRANNV